MFNLFMLNSASAYIFDDCHARVTFVRFRKTMGPSEAQQKTCLPFLVLQTQTFLENDSQAPFVLNFASGNSAWVVSGVTYEGDID